MSHSSLDAIQQRFGEIKSQRKAVWNRLCDRYGRSDNRLPELH